MSIKRSQIGSEHFTTVPVSAIRKGDSIVHCGLVATVNRVEASGAGYVVFPIHIADSTPFTGDYYDLSCNWYFPRYRDDATVRAYTPKFCDPNSEPMKHLYEAAAAAGR